MVSMKPIGIIGAMDIEITNLLSVMQGKEKVYESGLVFYKGKIEDVCCVVSKCNAGKVNAAVCTQIMIMKYSPKMVINIGVAGGVGKDIHIGDLVVADACVQHDFDTSPLGGEKGCVSGIGVKKIMCDRGIAQILKDIAKEEYENVHSGIIATGDMFVSESLMCKKIGEEFDAKAVEMEGGSIAHVCLMNEVPCAVIRAISDNADDEGKVDFVNFAEKSAGKTQKVISKALKRLM